MKIKGILFDKDGTLVDFYSLWLHAALDVVPEFLRINSIIDSKRIVETDILDAIGVKNGIVDPQGSLAYQPYFKIAEDIANALMKNDIEFDVNKIYEQIVELFNNSVTSSNIEYKTFTDLNELMKNLKSLNFYIGLATADTIESATQCLEKLGVLEYFDFVGGDDGILLPKPAPDMFNEFMSISGLKKEEIVVVGDTLCDMKFAKRCECKAIGVLSGVSSEKDLNGHADYIIPSINELTSTIELLI